MPVGKELSIVADSTTSSSPPLDVDATLQVKRATRTYGRRREEPQVEETVSPTSTLEDSTDILSVHNTAPPGLRDEVPPSSPRTHLVDSDLGGRDDDIETTSTAEPVFNFGWKDKLKKIDESDDDEDAEMATAVKGDDVLNMSGFGLPLLLQPSGSEASPSKRDSRKSLPTTTDLDEDVFQAGPSAGRTVSVSGAADPSSPSDASPTRPPPPGRSRKIRRIVAYDSDSEQEHPKDSSSTTASASSSKLKSRSSSTPPTSDEDDVPVNIIPKSTSAGKKKDLAAQRPLVPPLQFSEEAVSEVRKSSSVGKKKKTKAPTMKEQAEMIKERSRIMVQTAVSIPRAAVPSKYTIDSFFTKITAKQQPQPMSLTSDPIVEFSSPSKEMEAAPVQDNVPAAPPLRLRQRSASPENDDSGDDSDLPEIGEVLTAGIKKDSKQKELLEMKKRLLQQRSSALQDDEGEDDDDDELEIVQANPKLAVKEEQEHRRAPHMRPSEGRKRQMQLAQINPARQAIKAESAFSPVRKGHHGSLSILQQVDAKDLSQRKLNQLLAAEAHKKAQMEMEKKAAEWQKYGGRIVNHGDVQAQGLTAVIQNVAEKGLKVAEFRSAREVDMEEDEEDEDDEDWHPEERGSVTPEPVHEDEKVGSDEEERENGLVDVNMADNSDVADEERSTVRHPRQMIITSDSEEEDNDENAPKTSCGASSKESYRRATSSCDIGTEEEEDKENNTKLMYDRSEDKENTAVVRHGVLEQRSGSMFNQGDDTPTPPISPSQHRHSGVWNARNWDREDDDDDNNTPNQRRPLKDLISEESPMLSQMLPTNLTQSFTAKLQQASPLPNSTLAPAAPVLKPLFDNDNDDSGMNISGAFSQFSQADGEPSFSAARALQPGFSELFESTTQKEGKAKEISSDRNLKRSDTLALTQEFSALKDLQPPFQGSDTLIRKADAIFEKEQEFILEDATRKPQQKPELYVNDHGFLTQTRPTDSTPEIYRPSPSQQGLYNNKQNSLLSAMQSGGSRAPLRTLSMTSVPDDSPTQPAPLRRLQRFDRTPPPPRRRPLNDLPDSPILAESSSRNAFDALTKGAQKLKKQDGQLKSRPELAAAFLEDEAAESDDEDHHFGFVKPKTTEDDENGEDLDATLEELMDDKEMDQDTIAPELVHAKFMEQLDVDDQEIEKFHQGVIQGEQRLKRRRGVEVDDSDEDSEMEEENERARRAMKKLRKSDRHDIKTLENDESTRAFAESYNMTLKDDDAEFLYLEKEEGSGIRPHDLMQVDREGEGEDEQDENNNNNEPETVTHDEISRRVRQMQEEAIEETGMDPQDVSWVDEENEEEEEGPRVKTINTRVRARGRSQVALEPSDMDGMGAAFRKAWNGNNMTTKSSKQWYAQEQKSRNAGTSRSVGGSAITGHAKAKSRTTGNNNNHNNNGNGTVRAGSMTKRSNAGGSSSGSGTSSGSRSVRPAQSILAAISDKSQHFA